MTANGWCFRFRDELGLGDLYVGEPDQNSARTIAQQHLGSGSIEGEKEIPGTVRDFLELDQGRVVQGRVVSR